ncbi:hypothetical protein [Myxococcus sp. CA040A]|uniref:hypothetical protein n=1 Tax=Myxococcus sp. CA040A TaxID=2741738 RepID=UPI00157A9A25|nr:hypothetical protein [Myxococcus sp. CA040A]NTX03437.1 hypothetical protein [Myxococcus sp. CA040A]
MHPSRVLRAAALLLASVTLTPSALAAGETPQTNVPYVFVTVDSFVNVHATGVEITGVLRGESTARTIAFYFYTGVDGLDAGLYASRCERMALMAMNKPGAYLFEMIKGPASYNLSCRLTRRAATPSP